MKASEAEPDAGLAFWNDRSKLGATAGTNDFILTELEQRFLVRTIPPRSRVLDVGCGNAMSLARLAEERHCSGVGIDFSEGMVIEARKRVSDANLTDRIAIHQRRIPPVPNDWGEFDVVMTQRSLINLHTVQQQEEAFRSIETVVKPGGMCVMIECSMDGGDRTNELREQFGLQPINPPWHNLFFREDTVQSWSKPNFRLEALHHISSTYHFLSRVVYAAIADKTGEELRYDSEINKVALELPQGIGEFGPVKAWIWRKWHPSKYDR